MATGDELVAAFRTLLGIPYRYGGKDPVTGLDCSGAITAACRLVGVGFVAGSAAQIAACAPISVAQAQGIPGALLWREGHDGVSTGGPGVIEARAPVVVEGPWTDTYAAGKARWTRAGLIPGITYQEERVAVKLLYPTADQRTTSGFNLQRVITLNGKRVKSPHEGIDFGCFGRTGEPVLAPAAGRVVKSVSGRKPGQPASNASGGLLAGGRSGNGLLIALDAGGTVLLGHVAPSVGVDARVSAGQQVGVTDRSGTITGPHVHMEFWPTGAEPSARDFATALTKATPTPTPKPKEQDEMTPELKARLDQIVAWQQEQFNAISNRVGPINRGGRAIPLIQEVADIKTLATEIEQRVGPVSRPNGLVSLRQEVADAKTTAIRNEQSLETLTGAVLALTTKVDALSAAVADLAPKKS